MKHSTRSAADASHAQVNESWGTLRWLASGRIGNARDITIGRVTIKHGHANPRHRHPNSEEVLYLLSGRLRHATGDAVDLLEPGDTIVIPHGVFHNAASVGDVDADMIVAYPTGLREIEHE